MNAFPFPSSGYLIKLVPEVSSETEALPNSQPAASENPLHGSPRLRLHPTSVPFCPQSGTQSENILASPETSPLTLILDLLEEHPDLRLRILHLVAERLEKKSAKGGPIHGDEPEPDRHPNGQSF
jgi:hypothetical protein